VNRTARWTGQLMRRSWRCCAGVARCGVNSPPSGKSIPTCSQLVSPKGRSFLRRRQHASARLDPHRHWVS
jgi:hypothetical protein